MTATDIQVLLASIGAFLVTVGLGSKWLLMYIHAEQAKSMLAESNARVELSTRLYEEIRILRLELANSHAEKRIYLRRIFQLEGFIHSHPGIILPPMEGWPPT